jgi:hypothetical protein
MAMVPLLHTFIGTREALKKDSAQIYGYAIPPMAWVDNIFIHAVSPDKGILGILTLRDHLQRYWSLELGADSLQVLPPSGLRFPALAVVHHFEVCAELPCLGHKVRGDSSHTKALMVLVNRLWGAFCKQRAKKGDLVSRMLQFSNLNCSVAGFFISAIAPASTLSLRLDAVQRKMVSIIVGRCMYDVFFGGPEKVMAIAEHWRVVAHHVGQNGGHSLSGGQPIIPPGSRTYPGMVTLLLQRP